MILIARRGRQKLCLARVKIYAQGHFSMQAIYMKDMVFISLPL